MVIILLYSGNRPERLMMLGEHSLRMIRTLDIEIERGMIGIEIEIEGKSPGGQRDQVGVEGRVGYSAEL